MIAVLSYLGCILLWIGSTLLMIIKKNPICALFLFCLHFCELLVIGLKTGAEYGKKVTETVASCLCFGFLWWLPLRREMKRDTYTDDDFIRRPDDVVIRHD
ncbi:MAG: hypothetical protein IJ547_03025 [Clostridia bacterium]|nr:hypothetical protein [Clostridia bacterium]